MGNLGKLEKAYHMHAMSSLTRCPIPTNMLWSLLPKLLGKMKIGLKWRIRLIKPWSYLSHTWFNLPRATIPKLKQSGQTEIHISYQQTFRISLKEKTFIFQSWHASVLLNQELKHRSNSSLRKRLNGTSV